MVEDGKKISRRKLLRNGAIAAAAFGFGDIFVYEPRMITVEETTIPIANLPAQFEGYKIAQLSDFHLGNWMNPTFIQTAVEFANRHDPDLMVMTGDFVHNESRPFDEFEEAFGKCEAKDGVYAVLGNHDHWDDPKRIEKALMDNSATRILHGERVMIERSGAALALAGSDDLHHVKHHFDDYLTGIPPEVPVLMLQHQPDLAEDLDTKYRVDLMLSGHMHGGQVRIPFMDEWFVPSKYGVKFLKGLCQGKNCQVYVNRGLGGVAPGRPRFIARPEVSILTLTNQPEQRA